ncbi:MAG: YgiT-type zinc finger protein [Candidatus Riflebacteria bacterium]|nr:YgiT-type zinc finger protein [Candidatus Riflebacteria bacterium]
MRPPEPDHCPECGRGFLHRVLTSRTYQVEGQTITIDGLMPDQCSDCGAVVWPDEELQRGRQALAIVLRKAA